MLKNPRSIIARILKNELHKHPFVVPVVTLIVLVIATLVSIVFFGSWSPEAADSHVVQLSIEGEKQTLPTRAKTVGDFLDRVKVTIKDSDVVEPSVDTVIDADDFRINVYRAKPVVIIDGDRRIESLSAATTPRSIAAQVGVSVYPEDDIKYVEPSKVLEDQLLGTEIVIKRAVPIHLNLYGTPVTVRTHASSIREMLAEKNIKLAETDNVTPALDSIIKKNTQIFITRQGIKLVVESEKIDAPLEYVEDNGLSFGTTATRQQGSDGRRLVTYQIELKNNKEVGRKKIQEVIVREAVPRIIARGKAVHIPADKSRIMSAAGITSGEQPYAQYIISHENALWCPTRWQGQTYCPPYYEPLHSEGDTSIGYGVCQSTPANKMATFGSDWRTNVVTQLKWCSDYARRRYGTWENAYNFWTRNHWW